MNLQELIRKRLGRKKEAGNVEPEVAEPLKAQTTTLYRDENIYEDHDTNSRVLNLTVRNGKVRLNEGDNGPACAMMNGGGSYDRDLYEIDLEALMKVLKVQTIDDFYAAMRKRFGFYDGWGAFYQFLRENNLKFDAYAG